LMLAAPNKETTVLVVGAIRMQRMHVRGSQ
jgi:hypothetical protein